MIQIAGGILLAILWLWCALIVFAVVSDLRGKRPPKPRRAPRPPADWKGAWEACTPATWWILGGLTAAFFILGAQP